MSNDKPLRCIDPVIKFCQGCQWGWTAGSTEFFESGCTLGYDQGRPEDEPTEQEIKDFNDWCSQHLY